MGTQGFQEEARSTATELKRCRQERSQENGLQLGLFYHLLSEDDRHSDCDSPSAVILRVLLVRIQLVCLVYISVKSRVSLYFSLTTQTHTLIWKPRFCVFETYNLGLSKVPRFVNPATKNYIIYWKIIFKKYNWLLFTEDQVDGPMMKTTRW